MALERTDILHAVGVFRDLNAAAPTAISSHGLISFTRNGVGDYTARTTENIAYAESTADARAGANELVIAGAQITTQGVVRVKCFDTLGNPVDPVQLTITVQQVQAGPAGASALPPNPTPIVIPPPPGPVTALQLQSFTFPVVGALLIPGDLAEHVVIPSAPFALLPTAGPSMTFDVEVNFYSDVVSAVPAEFQVTLYLDGAPVGSRLATMPPSDGAPLRVELVKFSVTGGVAPGPHTVELRATSTIALRLTTGSPSPIGGQCVAVVRLLWSQ